jgi:hypothetical protein
MINILSWMHEEGIFDISQNTFLEYAIILINPKVFELTQFKNLI